jgi:hypothetical protein
MVHLSQARQPLALWPEARGPVPLAAAGRGPGGKGRARELPSHRACRHHGMETLLPRRRLGPAAMGYAPARGRAATPPAGKTGPAPNLRTTIEKVPRIVDSDARRAPSEAPPLSAVRAPGRGGRCRWIARG